MLALNNNTVNCPHLIPVVALTVSEVPTTCDKHMQHTELYSASHSLVALENVGLQKEQKRNTFVCHTCNEVRLCVLGIRKKEVENTKR
jgi:hypothetical protein